jgi:hypothetical protein
MMRRRLSAGPAWPGVNVGLRGCHGDLCIVSIDADVLDLQASTQVRRVLVDRLHRMTGCGLDIPYRVGRAPKFAIPVRVTEPVRKFKGRLFEIDGQDAVVEFIGLGAQLVIWGTHPSGRPYEWPLDGPGDIDLASLPLITPDQLQELKGLVEAELARFGTPKGSRHAGIRVGEETVAQPAEALLAPNPVEAAEAALALQNKNVDYSSWVEVAYALCGALGPEEGWRHWALFSQKSTKNRPAETRGVWRGVLKAYRQGTIRSGWPALRELAKADGWIEPPHPAAGLIERARAKAEEAKAEKPSLPRLPDFLPVSADRDGTLAAMRAKIEELVTAALCREAIRNDVELQEEAAKSFADWEFMEEVGKELHEELTSSERRKLSRRKTKAAKAARLEAMARNGIEHEADLHPKHDLITGVQGGGKTQAVIRKLAREAKGKVNFYVPTLVKAEEIAEALIAEGSIRPAIAVRGRMTEEKGEPKGGARMCGQKPELIELAQNSGLSVRKSICKFCPMRFDCAYLQQVDQVAETKDRILILSHEMLFLMPSWMQANLHIIDESVVTKFAIEDRIEPDLLFQPDLWRRVPFFERTALAVRDAMQKPGHELEELLAAGVTDDDLKQCAAYLHAVHDAELQNIREALEVEDNEGAAVRYGNALVRLRQLAARRLRPLARLLNSLRKELSTGRAGTNATRRTWVEEITTDQGGQKHKERVLRYVINRRRQHKLYVENNERAEVLLLDGTGSERLNQLVFGWGVKEHRFAVERLGRIIQLTDTTNSKHQLLYRKSASKNRKDVVKIIRHLHTIYGDKLLVGAPMPIERKLIEDGALDDVLSLHYGAERDVNLAEHCECVLVIGREQPNVYAIEAMARAFMMKDPQPFVSILDENGEGKLPTYERARRMRDGSMVLGEVTAHPDPVAQLFLEQVREAGIVQMVDRVRAVWNPKLIIVATNLPIDLDVDQLMKERELLAELEPVANIAGRGWHVGRLEVTKPESCNEYLLQLLPLVTSKPVTLPSRNGKRTALTLTTTLPIGQALKLAAVEHPGIRLTAPEDGILAECRRRFGFVPAWPELQRLMPEFLPDAASVKATEDAERAEMKRLREELPTAPYRVPGRRGKPSLVAYDPTRIPDIARTMAEAFGAGVTVEHPPAEEPAVQESTMEQRQHPKGAREGRPVAEPPRTRRPRPRSGGRRIWARPWEYRGQRPPDYGPSPADAELIQFARASYHHHFASGRGLGVS